MTTFDADRWLTEHTPWAVKLGGRVYVSRPVSVLGIQRFQVAVVAAGADGTKQRAAMRRLLRTAFPFRLQYWVTGDPVAQVLALDDAARQAVLADFFQWAARRYSPSESSTTGTASPPPTPIPSPTSAAAPVLA
jgi:hypothetical protein